MCKRDVFASLLARYRPTSTSCFNTLVVRLGCDYMYELFVARNAQYSSERIIAELLQCLAQVLEEKMVADIQTSGV